MSLEYLGISTLVLSIWIIFCLGVETPSLGEIFFILLLDILTLAPLLDDELLKVVLEDETLSCGTGAVASSIAFHFLRLTKFDKLKVETPGGTLAVEFKFNSGIYKDIYLKGPAEKVFSGKIKW